MPKSCTMFVPILILLGACEGESAKIRNSTEADVAEALDKAEEGASKAGEEVKEFGRNLKREAAETADQADFGSERATQKTGK